MIGIQCQWWFVEDTLEHPRVHFKYFYGWRFFGKLTFKSNFALWSSFQVQFERVVNGLGGQKAAQLSISTWSSGIQCKNKKFLSRESQEWKTCTFLGPKHKSAIWDGTPPHLHIKCSLYVWRRAHGLQIFNRNSIISIRSHFIAFLRFRLLRLQEGGAGGWGVCRVIRVSLDEFRNVQR